MEAITLVSLLEERLGEIKKNLGDSWNDFREGLKKSSQNLIPEKESLRKWTEEVISLFQRHSFTTGLILGVETKVPTRGIPSEEMVGRKEETPGLPTGQVLSPKEFERNLVERIKEIIKRAETL